PSVGRGVTVATLMPRIGVRSLGVITFGASAFATSFFLAAPFLGLSGTGSSFGAWSASSTLMMPFSAVSSQPRLCWVASIFETNTPDTLVEVKLGAERNMNQPPLENGWLHSK